MRRLGLIISLAIGTFGASGPAHADCALIDRIDKLYTIQSRLARDPATALFANDIRQIRIASADISNDEVLNAVNGNRFTGHGADVLQFLQNTRLLLQQASLDDPQSVRPHFNIVRRGNLDKIGQHLLDLRCNAAQIAYDTDFNSNRDISGTSDAEDLAEVAENLSALAAEVFQWRTLFLTLTLIAVVTVVTPIIRRWLILRRRRAKRHKTTYNTRYCRQNLKVPGVLIDINCFGTKLRHSDGTEIPKGEKIGVNISDQWIDGEVVWGNTHYSGVKFDNRISLKDVETVRRETGVANLQDKTKNGAPKDAV
ncbi:hypothetical protein [Roseobacter sp. CCS2]|uniref:hypothetical protein n=1 Tax=Roseobacter sp. CCS2 TaxID=391593 RepID=UPI0000F40572|nr:hypothetical protein [Roseobacter sp. CCS2]EBA11380.1 hypothetical protein RCCS2_01938 [Roseobacter sp. CCS2]